MRHWPETATAVAVRLDRDGVLHIAAPYGLEDLFGAVLRPTVRFVQEKRELFDARWQGKAWLSLWPQLQFA
jgi:hypothetical protein